MYVWNKSVLANMDLACLGDRMEMAHSIEGRLPFLDHHLTEYINSLPPSMKIRKDPYRDTFAGKWILREAAKPFITKEIYNRKKHVSSWCISLALGWELISSCSHIRVPSSILPMAHCTSYFPV